MDIDNLKYVVGKAKTNEPAVIRFFGSVDEWSSYEFVEEFLYLQNDVKPSKIVVLINSEGGCIISGMSVFSVIQSCPVETDCIIEGIAASMGSVIWAAGDNLYMHDYSLLMIHNPFISYTPDEDMSDDERQAVEAFKHQVATIYQRRFGLSKDQVKQIMDGEGDADGTFLTAQDTVKAGIIDKSHVIKTSQTTREKAKDQIKGVKSAASLRGIMSSICAELDENKLVKAALSIHNKKDNVTKMEEEVKNQNQFFETISAQLGLDNAKVGTISARIEVLKKAEGDLAEVKSKLTKLEVEKKGVEAELANVKSDLTTAQSELTKYKEAEKAAFEAKIQSIVDAAVKAGKIEDASREAWIKMAHQDFDTVEATLNSIPGRDNIVDEIATDPENEKHIQDAQDEADAKMKAKVQSVVGADFTLKKFNQL